MHPGTHLPVCTATRSHVHAHAVLHPSAARLRRTAGALPASCALGSACGCYRFPLPLPGKPQIPAVDLAGERCAGALPGSALTPVVVGGDGGQEQLKWHPMAWRMQPASGQDPPKGPLPPSPRPRVSEGSQACVQEVPQVCLCPAQMHLNAHRLLLPSTPAATLHTAPGPRKAHVSTHLCTWACVTHGKHMCFKLQVDEHTEGDVCTARPCRNPDMCTHVHSHTRQHANPEMHRAR